MLSADGIGSDIPTMAIAIHLNGAVHTIDVTEDMPLLWAVREVIGQTGTKFGCGIGVCGACTVLIDGAAERACVVPVGELAGRKVTTIEGLGAKGLHPVQMAWIAHDIPQCGYCQPGFVMQVVDLLTNQPELADADLEAAITNVCRCGTYPGMRRAIADARAAMAKGRRAA
jgi:isoquinoline 1-oxidoreductase alpha subunit